MIKNGQGISRIAYLNGPNVRYIRKSSKPLFSTLSGTTVERAKLFALTTNVTGVLGALTTSSVGA